MSQGCPLSPYLFGMIMTAIFQDIKAKINTPKQVEPIPGIHFSEILYADDTLIFGTHTHTINKLIHAIQARSAKYNMELNRKRCINLTLNQSQSSVKFLDGIAVPRGHHSEYLGATLTDTVDNRKEILRRIGQVSGIANQLGILWNKARTSITWKLRVAESVLYSKLLYGLESIQLT